MSRPPIHVNSRAWTGDPITQEDLDKFRRDVPSFRRKGSFAAVLALLAAGAGFLIYAAFDILIWRVTGSPAYVQGNGSLQPVGIGLASGLGAAVLFRLAGHARLWPVAIAIGILGTGVATNLRYLDDIAARAPKEPATFAIVRVELKHSGRRFKWDRVRPEARLVDGNGRRWTLEGSQAFIAALAGQDCITLKLRGGIDGYRFAEGAPSLTPTPYIDSIKGERHLSRCFAPAASQ